jgi:hypothetical protein
MHCYQNGRAYFATAVSYACKMVTKLTAGVQQGGVEGGGRELGNSLWTQRRPYGNFGQDQHQRSRGNQGAMGINQAPVSFNTKPKVKVSQSDSRYLRYPEQVTRLLVEKHLTAFIIYINAATFN